jgi:hypothetical protein
MCMITFRTICIVILFMNFTGLVAQEIPMLTTKDSVISKNNILNWSDEL